MAPTATTAPSSTTNTHIRPWRSAAAFPRSTPRSRNTMPTAAPPIPIAMPSTPSVALTGS